MSVRLNGRGGMREQDPPPVVETPTIEKTTNDIKQAVMESLLTEKKESDITTSEDAITEVCTSQRTIRCTL